ncbi:MAG TPA: hypothetical protein P5571_08965 [Candidatus Krumholzibacteria bacterium]|nr:hypothetical protein [Candidatus Krumholzibacteria bacterium]HRX51479.1 hypothetical protein [Candidatus Krumholzibacteria bacterium]
MAHRSLIAAAVRRAAAPLWGAALLLCLAGAAEAQMVTGSYTGDGSDGRAVTGLGFAPEVLIIKSDEDHGAVVTTAADAGRAKQPALDLAASYAVVASLDADGFTLHDDDAVNKNGVTYRWIAFAAAPGRLRADTYTGVGLLPTTIDVGFRPAYVMVLPAGAVSGLQRSEAMPDGVSVPFGKEAAVSGAVSTFTDTGFTVTGARTNALLASYTYVAWAADPDRLSVGAYTGDGAASRLLSGLGLHPSWALTKGAHDEEAVHLGTPLNGTLKSQHFDDKKNEDKDILQLAAGSVRIGGDKDVNEDGETYYWTAFGNLADLHMSVAVDRDTALEGETVVLTLTAANEGPDPVEAVSVALSLPSTLEVSDPSVQPGGDFDVAGGLWTLDRVPAGGSRQLQLTGLVLDGAAGQVLSVTATAKGFAANDPDPDDNAGTAAFTVPYVADLAATAAASAPYPDPGATVVLTFGMTNQGPDAATSVLGEVVLPAGLTYVSHTLTGGSYDAIAGEWTLSTLGAAAVQQLLITAAVGADQAGQDLTSSLTVSAAEVDPDPADDTASVTVTGNSADLRVVKTVDVPSPLPGGQVTFQIALFNDGPADAAGVRVIDLLPAGLTYVGSTVSHGNYASGNGQWRVGDLAAGDGALLQITAQVSAGATGAIVNTATIDTGTPADGNPANNSDSATITIRGADVAAAAAVVPASADPGDTVEFTFDLTNQGALDATGVTAAVTLPAGLTYAGHTAEQGAYDSGSGAWTVGGLTAAATARLRVSATVDPGTAGRTLDADLAVTGMDQTDIAPANDTASAALTVRAVNLALSKSVDDPAPSQGSQVVFTLLVTNNGPDAATGVAVADTLPAGLLYVSDSPDQGAYDPVTGLWSVGDLAPAATARLDLTAQVNLDVGSGDTAVNHGWITTLDQEDPDLSDNDDTAALSLSSADLNLSAAVDQPAPVAGDPVRFTLTLRNDGPSAATGVTVRDTLAPGLTYQAHAPALPAYDPVTGVWDVGDLAAGAELSLTIDALVDADRSGNVLTTRPRVTPGDQSDPDDTDNLAPVTLTVQAADLGLAWLPLADPTEGDTLTARLALQDGGPDTLQDAVVQVGLPAGLTLLDAVASHGAYAAGQWSVGALASAATATLDLALLVDAGTAGQDLALDAAVASARPGDPTPAAQPDTLAFHVRGTDLELTKLVNVASARPGETVIYTLSVRNAGPDAAGAVTVNDRLPAGLTYLAHTPAGAAYDPVSGDWQVGPVAVDQTATLFLQARVATAAPGDTVVNVQTLLDADLVDTAAGNDAASAAFTVPAADIGLSWSASAPAAAVGDTVDLVLHAVNDGPDPATGLVVTAALPLDLTLLSAGAGFDPVQGRWVVGDVAVGAAPSLTLRARVGADAAGDTLHVTAAVTELEQGDPHPDDDTAALHLPVAADADLAVALAAGAARADVGDTLTWTVALTNHGPSAAAGVAVADSLPTGMSRLDAAPGQGSYDAAAGLWTVGDLAADATAQLVLRAVVLAGTGGADLTAAASVAASSVGDRDPANDRAAASVHVNGADLVLDGWLDVTEAGEGDEVIVTFAVSNLGPDPASGVALLDSLPAGLSYVSHTPPGESYTDLGDGVWRWDVGAVQPGTPRVLFLRTRVDAGTTGAALRHAAAVTPGAEEDPDPANNAVADLIQVVGADVGLTCTVEPAVAAEGDTVRARLVVANAGPLAAHGVTVTVTHHAKLELLGATPEGVFEAATGRWSAGSVAAGAADTLTLDLRVAELSGGLALDVAGAVTQLVEVDPTPDDAAAAAAVTVAVPGSGRLLLSALPVADAVVWPLDEPVDLLRLQAVNWSVRTDTLQTLALTDAAVLDGQPAGAAAWQGLELWRDEPDGWSLLRTLDDPFGAKAAVADLGLVFAPGDTMRLAVRGAASAAASDSTRLAVSLDSPQALGFGSPVTVEAEWPLATAASIRVDGFVAAQAAVHPVAAAVVPPGAARRLALDLTLPADGARATILQDLQLVNLGTAQPVVDVARLEVWADAGDAALTPATDILLGEAVWTGDRWRLSGLSQAVGPQGLRLFVSCDAASAADGQRSLRLAVPMDGVSVQGGNDGPLDAALANPFTLQMGGSDRLFMAAVSRPWRVVQPDGAEELLLHLTATNTYAEPRTLQSLRLTGDVRSPWTDDPAVLDAVVAQLVLRADADGDGEPGADDPILGAVSLSEGEAVFGGLAWSVEPATTRHLFVSARLAPDLAADGDDVAVHVASAVDVQLDADADVSAAWPLDGGGGLRVDGLLARRVTVRPGATAMAPPGAADRLVLDVRVPGNGHAADVLNTLVLENRGSAAPSDLAALRLWRDGGDDAFDAGADGGDDVALTNLTSQFGAWTAASLGLDVPAAGVRLYVAADLAAGAADSATVDLAVPLGGLGYASDDDGPLDLAVPAGRVLMVGDGALLADLALTPAEALVGQDLQLVLQVRNTGLDTVSGVTPRPLSLTGDGAVEVVAGPAPAAADLAPGALASFVWTLRGAQAGHVTVGASAAGLDPLGAVMATPVLTAPELRIVQPAPSLVLTVVSQLPFAVNGGQPDVNALTLTLHHPGDAAASPVRLDSLRVRVEDGTGAPVDAAAVVGRASLRADGALLLAAVPEPGAGHVLPLAPASPPLLAPGGTLVLTLAVDVAQVAPGMQFRFLIDADALAVHDAVAGAAVAVEPASGAYPAASALTRVVAGAPPLQASIAGVGTEQAARGQTAVPLGLLRLENPGDPELGAAIEVGLLRLGLTDADGAPLAALGAVATAVELRRDGVLAARRLVAPSDTVLILTPDTPLDVAPGEPLELTVLADLSADAPLAPFRLQAVATELWDVRDANSGVPVDVTPVDPPLLADPVAVVQPAALAHLGGRTLGLSVLTAGAADQPLLEWTVRHPGAVGLAPVRVDSLALTCLDARGDLLDPAAVLTGVTVRAAGVDLTVAEVASDPAGRLRLALPAALVEPGATLALTLLADVRADALADTFRLVSDLADVRVVDSLLAVPVPLTADAGAVLPLTTGLRQVQIAADELLVSAWDRMPAALAALGDAFPVLGLELVNAAPASAGDLVLTDLRLALTSTGAGKAAAAAGTMVAEVVVVHGGDVWASSGALTPGDSLVAVSGATPLLLAPGRTEPLEIRLVLADGVADGGLVAALDLDGLSVRQPEGALVPVDVRAASGQAFPLVTQAGTVSAASLESSYSNFPNPFAAGRAATTFVFALPAPGRVSLRVFTPRGEPVRTLLDGEERAAGLHQDVVWDGRNGQGDVVRNGVYVAEIVVRSVDGAVTLRRNVAVVR